MRETVYQFEILHKEKHQSWDFDSAEKRNEFYKKVVTNFSGEEYKEKNDAIGNSEIVEVTTNNVYVGELKDIAAGIHPQEWYEESMYRPILEFVEREYHKHD